MKKDRIFKLDKELDFFVEYNETGGAKVGLKSKKGITSGVNGLLSHHFNVNFPREAKVCQGFFDDVIDPNDLAAPLHCQEPPDSQYKLVQEGSLASSKG